MTKSDHSPASLPLTPDISALALLTAVLKAMIALTLLLTIAGGLFCPVHLLGLITGAAVGLSLYLIAWYAGRMAILWRRFVPAMLLLFGLQALIWIITAAFLSHHFLDGGTFAIGVGVLPLGIVGTVLWRAIFGKGEAA